MPRLPYSLSPSARPHWEEAHPRRVEREQRRARVPLGYQPPNPPPYDLKETLDWWKFIRTDEWWRTQMPISIRALKASVNYESHLREDFDEIPPAALAGLLSRVARVIDDIERRALAFPKPGWKGNGGTWPSWLRLLPPAVAPKIPRLCGESDWSLWAACSACGKNQFVPCSIDEKPHVACYHCSHPRRNNYGAAPVEKSLIHPALKKYC